MLMMSPLQSLILEVLASLDMRYYLGLKIADMEVDQAYFVKKLSARCYNPNRKSLVAFYGILCRLKVSETPFVTTVDDRLKLLKVLQELDFFGHNPINEEEISEIYKFFEKWKKSPKYPVNRLKRLIENLEDEIENIGPDKPEL